MEKQLAARHPVLDSGSFIKVCSRDDMVPDTHADKAYRANDSVGVQLSTLRVLSHHAAVFRTLSWYRAQRNRPAPHHPSPCDTRHTRSTSRAEHIACKYNYNPSGYFLFYIPYCYTPKKILDLLSNNYHFRREM